MEERQRWHHEATRASCTSERSGWQSTPARTRRRDRGARARIGGQLSTNPGTLRSWLTQAKIYASGRPGTTTADADKLAERELRRANATLRTASAFFAAELDRPLR